MGVDRIAHRPHHHEGAASDGVDPRVCVIPHGWWQACPALGLPGYPDGTSNANTLTSDRSYNDEFMTPACEARCAAS